MEQRADRLQHGLQHCIGGEGGALSFVAGGEIINTDVRLDQSLLTPSMLSHSAQWIQIVCARGENINTDLRIDRYLLTRCAHCAQYKHNLEIAGARLLGRSSI